MPVDLADLVAPARAAVVTQECQNGVIGAESILPELAKAAAKTVVPNGTRILDAARRAGVPVIHCLAARRADGLGANRNARLFAATAKLPPMLPGSSAASVVDEFGPAESDLVLTRVHGLGPMGGTDLDAVLRNLGVSTVVGIGVSVNIGMTNFAFDAVNAGYQFVLPRDAVAGVPDDYAQAVLDHSLALVATLATTDEIVDAWRSR